MGKTAGRSRGRQWWTSWPVIAAGFFFGIFPGAALLAARRGVNPRVRWGSGVFAVLFFLAFMATATTLTEPGGDAAAVAVPSASATPAAPSPSADATASPPVTAPEPSPSAAPALSPSPTPTATPGASEPADDDRIEHGTAYAAALELEVKGRAAKTGYDRDEFGSGWVDTERNGCDTRNDMLKIRLVDREMSGSCKVLAGDLDDPYTGTWVHFEYGGASEVDIDHMVALSDAWQKGAASWEFAKRVAFANDPLNLEPVDAGANRQKGDADAATWLPSHKDYRCEYVARQVAVKQKYELWVTQAELDAILNVLDTCPDYELPGPGDRPVIAENTGGPPPSDAKSTAETDEPAPKETAAPKETEPQVDERFPYCKDLPSGYGPYYKGKDPEYEWYRDGDGDGVVCE